MRREDILPRSTVHESRHLQNAAQAAKIATARERERLVHAMSGAIGWGPAASIGGAVILAGSATATGLLLSRNERRANRREAYALEVRTRAAAVFELLFVVQHAMEWVTWHAAYQPLRVDHDLSTNYEKEVHNALPAILGALAQMAALNRHLYELITPDAQYVFRLEFRVARALAAAADADEAPAAAVRQLGELNGESKALYLSMPMRLAEIMDAAQQARLDREQEANGRAKSTEALIAESISQDEFPTGRLKELADKFSETLQAHF